MRRRGFTLIELLVVIAIIAILAAILFPVFLSAKQKAQQSACLSNQRQIGSGLVMYIEAYNDKLPENCAGGDYTQVQNRPDHWFSNEMMKFVKNQKVWDCPTAVTNPPNSRHTAARRDYGLASIYCAAKTSTIRSTSKTPVITDCLYSAFRSDEEVRMYPGWFTYYWPNRIHNEGANFVFVDGHAEWSKKMVVFSPEGEYRLGDLP